MSKPKIQPSVYIVTPIFNAKDQTLKFIDDLKSQSYKELTIIIVDDGSTDGAAEAISQMYPDVIIVRGSGNLWWAGATNLGVKYALKHKADFILTINHDLSINKSYVKTLVDDAINHAKALIGSLVVYETDPNQVWFAGAYFDYKRGEMQHTNGSITEFKGRLLESDWLSGMGVLIPSEVFEKIGYYNEKDFPQYFGDSDFSIRAKQAGYKLLVSGSAIIESDVKSSWVHRQIAKPHLGMFKDLFFSIRSPYQIKSRVAFYRLYWGKHWRYQLVKLYCWTMRGIYFRFTQAYLKKLIRR